MSKQSNTEGGKLFFKGQQQWKIPWLIKELEKEREGMNILNYKSGINEETSLHKY